MICNTEYPQPFFEMTDGRFHPEANSFRRPDRLEQSKKYFAVLSSTVARVVVRIQGYVCISRLPALLQLQTNGTVDKETDIAELDREIFKKRDEVDAMAKRKSAPASSSCSLQQYSARDLSVALATALLPSPVPQKLVIAHECLLKHFKKHFC